MESSLNNDRSTWKDKCAELEEKWQEGSLESRTQESDQLSEGRTSCFTLHNLDGIPSDLLASLTFGPLAQILKQEEACMWVDLF